MSGEARDPDQFGHPSIFALCSPVVNHDSAVPFASRNMFAIQEFQERNRIFAGYSGPGLEFGDGEFGPCPSRQNAAQRLNGGGVEDQFFIYFYQLTIAIENLKKRPRAIGVDSGFGDDLGG